MKEKDFQPFARKAVIYYVADAPEFHSLMDDLCIACTEKQWDRVGELLEEADAFLAESEVGTLYQKEKALAKAENRPSRYPTSFDDNEARKRKIAFLREDFKKRNISYQME